jgi:hypothetical protein
VTYTGVNQLSETSGADPVANQVLWVTSNAVYLDNMKLAVNGTGTPGVTYSTGTLIHEQVKATTNTNTVQTFEAKEIGTSGNSIPLATTMTNSAVSAATMGSGTLTDGRVICNTITFSAVATTGERVIDLGGINFTRGLLAVVGGTADLTIGYTIQ